MSGSFERRKNISESVMTASDGFKMFYRATFPRRPKAAMVFLHGMNLHSGVYEDVIERLGGEDILTLAPDQRGRGRSVDDTWRRGDILSLPRMVNDVAELIKHHARDIDGLPVFMTGVSFGAVIAMMYAREKGHSLKGLVIAGPPFGNSSAAVMKIVRGVLASKINPRIAVKRAPQTEEVYASKEYRAKLDQDPLFNRNPLRAGPAAEIIQVVQDIDRHLGDIKIPLLMIYGSADRLMRREQLGIIKKKWGCEDCTIELVDGIGHDVINEADVSKLKGIYFGWVLTRVQKSSSKG